MEIQVSFGNGLERKEEEKEKEREREKERQTEGGERGRVGRGVCEGGGSGRRNFRAALSVV